MFVWLILAAKCWLSISLKASNQRGLHESLHWVGDRLEARALGLLVESPKRTGRASGKDSALYDSAEYHHSIYLHTMMMMKIWICILLPACCWHHHGHPKHFPRPLSKDAQISSSRRPFTTSFPSRLRLRGPATLRHPAQGVFKSLQKTLPCKSLISPTCLDSVQCSLFSCFQQMPCCSKDKTPGLEKDCTTGKWFCTPAAFPLASRGLQAHV